MVKTTARKVAGGMVNHSQTFEQRLERLEQFENFEHTPGPVPSAPDPFGDLGVTSMHNHVLMNETDSPTLPVDATPKPVTSARLSAESSEMPVMPASPEFTRINGIGLWHSWTRNFKSPLLACLDLLDNCLDAALHPRFEGRVHIERELSTSSTNVDECGLSITNNSYRPVRPLHKVLEVYNSTKGKHGDSVGENGVGLKQGCATLSDTSFVLTRDRNDLALGVIAASLQREAGVRLPSFQIHLDVDDTDASDQAEKITEALEEIVEQDEGVRSCIEEYGGDRLEEGISRLMRHFLCLMKDEWGDNVFRLVLTDLRHGSGDRLREGSSRSTDRAVSLMKELRHELPRNYIHVPVDFDFRVDEKPVRFSYWQRRLVELSRFTVQVDPDRSLNEYEKNEDSWRVIGYGLTIYCGFDCLRLSDAGESACALFIYSRSSGRLIKCVEDARHELGLISSGSDYSQSLTVIVDDVTGRLPLNPTKQDLAFGEEQNGFIHKNNLNAWIGAVAHCFWNYHAEKFDTKKKLLRDAVARHIEAVSREQLLEDVKRPMLERADLSTFGDIQWRKSRVGVRKEMQIRLNKKATLPFIYKAGRATLFRIEPPPEEVLRLHQRKRKSSKPLFAQDSDDEGSSSAQRKRTSAAAIRPPAGTDEDDLACIVADLDDKQKQPQYKNRQEQVAKAAQKTRERLVEAALTSPALQASRVADEEKIQQLQQQLAEEKEKSELAREKAAAFESSLDQKDKIIRDLKGKVRHLNKMMQAMINSQSQNSDDECEL